MDILLAVAGAAVVGLLALVALSGDDRRGRAGRPQPGIDAYLTRRAAVRAFVRRIRDD